MFDLGITALLAAAAAAVATATATASASAFASASASTPGNGRKCHRAGPTTLRQNTHGCVNGGSRAMPLPPPVTKVAVLHCAFRMFAAVATLSRRKILVGGVPLGHKGLRLGFDLTTAAQRGERAPLRIQSCPCICGVACESDHTGTDGAAPDETSRTQRH